MQMCQASSFLTFGEGVMPRPSAWLHGREAMSSTYTVAHEPLTPAPRLLRVHLDDPMKFLLEKERERQRKLELEFEENALLILMLALVPAILASRYISTSKPFDVGNAP